jgi:cysteine desulfurase
MSAPIYLDNSATTKVRDEICEVMKPFLCDRWGNASSIHRMGRQSQLAMAFARQQVAKLINCTPEEIYFAPCGTYANNVAILGRARFAEANNQGRHLITTQIEHSAILGPAKHLESMGWTVTYLPVDKYGIASPEALKKAITKETSIISVMWANNEIGSVQPIQAMAEIAAASGIYFHTDAIQVTGRIPVDMAKTPVSALSLSGHKFYAPKGIGALYLRKGSNVMPLMFGGGQERGLFPGTEGLANIIAMGKAAELALEELQNITATLREMQDRIIQTLTKIEGVKLTGPVDLDKRLPGHVSLVVPGVEGETLVLRSDLKGVCISSGSACHHGITEPSHVLKAIGLSNRDALGSARISAGRYNTMEEVDRALEILMEVITSCPQTVRV